MGFDLNTAPHSHTVSMFPGEETSFLLRRLTETLTGTAAASARGAKSRQVAKNSMIRAFLAPDVQKRGSSKTADNVVKRAKKTPVHSVVLTEFQFDFENGLITKPMMSHTMK